jgi:hypothetical protein
MLIAAKKAVQDGLVARGGVPKASVRSCAGVAGVRASRTTRVQNCCAAAAQGVRAGCGGRRTENRIRGESEMQHRRTRAGSVRVHGNLVAS